MSTDCSSSSEARLDKQEKIYDEALKNIETTYKENLEKKEKKYQEKLEELKNKHKENPNSKEEKYQKKLEKLKLNYQDGRQLEEEKKQRRISSEKEKLKQRQYASFFPRAGAFLIDSSLIIVIAILSSFLAFYIAPEKAIPTLVDFPILGFTKDVTDINRKEIKQGEDTIIETTTDVFYKYQGETYAQCRHVDRLEPLRSTRGTIGTFRKPGIAEPCTVQDRLDVGLMMFLALWLLYAPILESSPLRATLGKRLLKLKVERPDGARLLPLRAFCRNLAEICNILPIGLGYLMPLISSKRQALHDAMTDCVVRRAE